MIIKRKHEEHSIQAALVMNVRNTARDDVIWHSIPNAAKRGYGTVNALQAEGMIAGVPDLLFVIDGLAHYLEMKKPGGSLSIAQLGFHARCVRSGVPWEVADNLAAALNILTEWKVFGTPSQRAQAEFV